MHPHHSPCTLVNYRVLRGFTIGNPLGSRDSTCVEVMTTLHGSVPSLRRRAEGCVLLERLPPYTWVHLRAFRASLVTVRVEGDSVHFFERSDMDQRVVIVDQFTTTMAFIQEALANLRQDIDMPQAPPYLLHGHSEVTTPTVVHTTVFEDTHARMDRIEQCIRELTLEGAAWLMDLDGNQFSEPTNVDQLKKYYV
ncbi:hypothetical protein CK203_085592 [Vitis vinifera]|uniref:Uncharacterized protein n=1 Tax=Vitis vinifera TaxID=29760 RepID=A0A438BWF8_VITVI|nr:hypothetical protein CK203_085592 [Vitis vinifera]